MIATVGAFMLGVGFLVFLVDFLLSLWKLPDAGDNPWGADTLEWSLTSPPAGYSYRVPPYVGSRHPLWESGPEEQENIVTRRMRQALDGQPCDWRGNLVTDALEARPQAIQWLPGPSYVPLFASLAVLVATVAILAKAYILVGVGTAAVVVSLFYWLWPDEEVIRLRQRSEVGRQAGLPLFPIGTASLPWWGMLGFVAVLGVILGVLVFCYFYLWLYSDRWPQEDLPMPRWQLPGIAAALLLMAAGAKWWGWRSMSRKWKKNVQGSLATIFLCLVGYLGLQLYIQLGVPFTHRVNAYGSIFWVIMWYQCLVALVGVAINLAAQDRVRKENIDLPQVSPLLVQMSGSYVYFTAASGVIVFVVLHVAPYLIGA
jgi:cytochrome c oxidase subunit I+III